MEEEGGSGGAAGGLGGAGEAAPAPGGEGDQGGGEFSGPEWAKGIEGLDQDILSDPALGPIKGLDGLVKSYVHAQRKIGEKGVVIPNENSTKEEWDTFYQKVGVPLEEDKYKENFQFSEEDKLGEEFTQGFVKKAHELRVSPKQANEIYKYFEEQATAGSERYFSELQEQRQADLDKLADEWGHEAYKVKLAKTENFLKENVGDEFLQYLGESGLGKDAKVVKALSQIVDKFTKEEDLPKGGGPTVGMTKDEMQKEINNVMTNFDDPYHKPSHPDHKRRVDEIQKYFAKLG